MMLARPGINVLATFPSRPRPRQEPTIIQHLPPFLQPPQLLRTLLILPIRLQTRRMPRHRLVHRHHNPQRIRRRRQIQRQRRAKVGQLGRGFAAGVFVQVAGDGKNERGEGADAVEGWEEFFAIVQKVGGHGAGVLDRDIGELEHGHDEGGLEDGAAEVGGGAYYGEGLDFVSAGRSVVVLAVLLSAVK